MATKKNVTDQYRDHLTNVGKSPHTVRAYSHDLAAFTHWFEQTTGEDFDSQAVDPRDIQEYKGYLIQTLLGTGLRISELAALKGSDLEISERKGWLCLRKGKGSKARDIPLDNRTRQVLSSYLEERPGGGTERLFLGQRGPLSEARINYLVTKYAYQAKLEDCTSHTLRYVWQDPG